MVDRQRGEPGRGTVEEQGRLIARGRDADVYAAGDGRVLRRYRDGDSVAREAELMRYLAAAGYPVPAVYGAHACDMVLEHLHGPTMLQDLLRRPWRLRRHARTLADLHRRLHAITAPDWLEPHPASGDAPTPGAFEGAGGGAGGGAAHRVLHMDLHPENVVLTARGPVVIDWRTARGGPPGLDVAQTLVILYSATAPGPPARRAAFGLLRAALLRAVRDACADQDPGPYLAACARDRLANPNTTPGEADRLHALFVSAPAGGPPSPHDLL
ncbi:phosphotransferase [Allostreptomyces psammosilenae]|uniref:Aminoglycoside phosphotransferase (APT) family kinase protein n=1 Tax=Allostreptomyces psammosilenae TaxID=1892865 RepID=A0A852ZYZ5_9ACTN|nr:phosphotransferase [Allostreptomyces psammosilenae]NYI05934.1 aminoglycoside phosphotransferase (APT) family kinase protein [Allostreptomyces psammosilenae]